jgi:hypothetical protein
MYTAYDKGVFGGTVVIEFVTTSPTPLMVMCWCFETLRVVMMFNATFNNISVMSWWSV